MTQIFLSSPTSVTINLARGKVFSVTPGISSNVTVAVPAESVGSTVSAAANFGPYLADRELVLNLALGTAAYEVLDQPPVSKGSAQLAYKKIVSVGDSFLQQGFSTSAYSATVVGSVAGITVDGLEILADATSHTLTITPDLFAFIDGGPQYRIRTGMNVIPIAGALTGIVIRVNSVTVMGGGGGTLTVTRSTLNGINYQGNSVLNWLTIFSGQTVRVVNGASGGTMVESLAYDGVAYLAASGHFDGASGIVFCAGTNDVSANRTFDQIKGNIDTVLSMLDAYSIPVYVIPQPPYRTGWTAGQRDIMSKLGAWLRGRTVAMKNGIYVNAFKSMCPETGTSLRTGYTYDSIHPSDAAAQLAGYELWSAMDAPYWDIFPPSANVSSFGVDAPLANYLSTQYLIGDAAGLATTPALTKTDSNSVGTASKVPRTDGIAGDWQQISMTVSVNGGYSEVKKTSLTAPAGGFPTAGTYMTSYAEIVCSGGTQLPPQTILGIRQGASLHRSGRSGTPTLTSQNLVMPSWRGVVKTPPQPIIQGDTAIDFWFRCTGSAATAGAITQIGRVMICADF